MSDEAEQPYHLMFILNAKEKKIVQCVSVEWNMAARKKNK